MEGSHFGQVIKCSECQFSFCPDIKKEIKKHLIYHDKHINGHLIKLLKSDKVIWCQGDLQIIVINQLSSITQRKRAEDIARLANHDTEFDLPSYNAYMPINEENIHVFLLLKDDRAIGFLSMIISKEIWKTSWRDIKLEKESIKIDNHSPIWCITRIWILKAYRKQHLAENLLDKACKYFGCNLKEVGWLCPFTELGSEFIQKCCPDDFYII